MLIPFFIGVVCITLFDQLTKLIVLSELTKVSTVELIEKVFYFTYCENTGAGFSIFAEHTGVLAAVSCCVIVAMILYVVLKKPQSRVLNVALTFLVGGAIGNLIDRVRLGFVVDFLDFRLIDFPIFNVADCFVTIGAALFIVYIIFIDGKQAKEKKTIENENTAEKEQEDGTKNRDEC